MTSDEPARGSNGMAFSVFGDRIPLPNSFCFVGLSGCRFSIELCMSLKSRCIVERVEGYSCKFIHLYIEHIGAHWKWSTEMSAPKSYLKGHHNSKEQVSKSRTNQWTSINLTWEMTKKKETETKTETKTKTKTRHVVVRLETLHISIGSIPFHFLHLKTQISHVRLLIEWKRMEEDSCGVVSRRSNKRRNQATTSNQNHQRVHRYDNESNRNRNRKSNNGNNQDETFNWRYNKSYYYSYSCSCSRSSLWYCCNSFQWRFLLLLLFIVFFITRWWLLWWSSSSR